jgi:arginase
VGNVSLIGFPDSLGSYAAGQEQAPAALRAAGLVEALVSAGMEVHDAGDLPIRTWKPDHRRPYAQNVEQVVTGLQELRHRLGPLLQTDGLVLVVGGNCTIALAVMAALRDLGSAAPGLLYFDRNYDLNTPGTTTDGALDWMGLAHGLALPGCVDELVDAFGYSPLLRPDEVAWVGVDPVFATEWERQQAATLQLHVRSSEQFAADPSGTTASGLGVLPPGPLAIHVDVDVLNFTDAPLAENTDGRNTGPTLDQLGAALRLAAADPRLRVFSIGELNPTRAAGDPDAIARFVSVISAALAAAARS